MQNDEPDLDVLWKRYQDHEKSWPGSKESLQWLDLFVDGVLSSYEARVDPPPGIHQSIDLARAWMNELKEICLPSNIGLNQNLFRKFLLDGRGWKILAILDRISSYEPEAMWWSMEFVDLMMNLFQLVLEFDNVDDICNRAASLIESQIEEKNLKLLDIISLWKFVEKQYKPTKRERNGDSTQKCRKKRKERQLLRKRPNPLFPFKQLQEDNDDINLRSSSNKGAHVVEDLHRAEPHHFESESDDTDLFNIDCHRHSHDIKAYPANPLDFEYFEMEMNSADEAKLLIDWHKSRDSSKHRKHDAIPLASPGPEFLSKRSKIGAISVAHCSQLMISLLFTLYESEVKKRNLHSIYMLSLKLCTFSSEYMVFLERKKNTSSEDEKMSVKGIMPETDLVKTRLMLAKLLLETLAEMSYGKLSSIELNEGPKMCISLISDIMNTASFPKDRLLTERAIDLASSVLHVIGAQHERDHSDYEVRLTQAEWSTFENLISTLPKIRYKQVFHQSIISFFSSLVFMLVGFREPATCIYDKRENKFCCKILDAALQCLEDISVPHPKIQLTKAMTNDFIDFLRDTLSVFHNYSSSLAEINGLGSWTHFVGILQNVSHWEYNETIIRMAIKAADAINANKLACAEINTVLEGALLLPENKLGSFTSPIVSDSDSAFCPSDASADHSKSSKRHKQSSYKVLMKLLNVYKELMQVENEFLATSVALHVKNLLQQAALPLQHQLFTKVVVPQIDERSNLYSFDDLTSLAATEINVLDICFSAIPPLLRKPEILEFFHNRKVISSIIAFKSVPDLIESSYAVLNGYLSAEIKFLLGTESLVDEDTKSCLRNRSQEIEMSSADSENRDLTEDEAFKPEMMKALNLTTIVKEFHEILMSSTAKVLDFKKTKTLTNQNRCAMILELEKGWWTQCELINQFKEYQDYAHSKGIPRIIEDLFHVLWGGDTPFDIDQYWKPLINISGYLLEILIDFEKSKSVHDDSFSSFPSSCFDERKILDNCLKHLSQSAQKIGRGVILRYLIQTLLKSAHEKHFGDAYRVSKESHMYKEFRHDIEPDYESGRGYVADISDNDDNCTDKCQPQQNVNLNSPKLVKWAFSFCALLLQKDHTYADELCEYTSHVSRKFYSLNCSSVNLVSSSISNSLLEIINISLSRSMNSKELFLLFSELAQEHFCRNAFKQFLNLFKSDKISIKENREKLLDCLNSIASSSCSSVEPEWSISLSKHDETQSATDITFQLPIQASNLLASNNSFCLSIWMATSLTEKCADLKRRIITLHDRLITFEVFTDGRSIFVDILTSLEENQLMGIAQFSLCDAWKLSWNHLSISCIDLSSKGWEISVAINGTTTFPKAHVPVKTPFGFEARDMKMTIGGVKNDDQRNTNVVTDELDIRIASIQIFENITLSPTMALILCLLRPYPYHLNMKKDSLCGKEIFRAFPELNRTLCNEDFDSNVEVLKKSILASFEAKSPNELVFYPHDHGSQRSFLGQLMMHGQTGNLSPSEPILVHALNTWPFAKRFHFRFGSLILQEGGVISLVLLVARLVECQTSDEDLARALDLLFTVIHSSIECKKDFLRNDGVFLLQRILNDERCNFNFLTILTILNHACTEDLFCKSDLGHQWHFDTNSKAILHDSSLLVLLLHCYKSLHFPLDPHLQESLKCSSGAEVVLQAFCNILNNDLTISLRNHEVFRQLLVPKTLLYKFFEEVTYTDVEENFESTDKSQNESRVPDQISEIFSLVIGSPPEKETIDDIIKCLILLHGSKLTYVTSTRSRFYLVLSSLQQHCSEKFSAQTDDGIETTLRVEKQSEGPNEALLKKEDMKDDESSHNNAYEHPGQWGIHKNLNCSKPPTSLDRLMIGLLDVLIGALQTLPDSEVEDVLGHVVLPEYLIAMSNHPIAKVREKVVWAIWHATKRASLMCKDGFDGRMRKILGYQLLANQLHQYPVTEGIVNACLSLLHNEYFNLDENPEISSYTETSVRATALSLVLSVLPNCIHNDQIAVAHSVILHMHELFAKSPSFLFSQQPSGFYESLAKAIMSISHLESCSTDIFGQDSREVIIEDLCDLFRLIAIRLVFPHGYDAFASLMELVSLLVTAGKVRAIDSEAFDENFARIICTVFEEAIAEIQTLVFKQDHPLAQSSKLNLSKYTKLFNIEEPPDILMRDLSPNGSEISTGSSSSILNLSQGGKSVVMKPANKNELLTRLETLVSSAVEFLTSLDIDWDLKEYERLTAALLGFMISELKAKREKSFLSSKSTTSQMLHPEKLRKLLLTLINHNLRKSRTLEKRVRLINVLGQNFDSPDTFTNLFENAPALAGTFELYVQDILAILEDNKEHQEELAYCKRLLEWMRLKGFKSILNGCEENRASAINYEVDKLKFSVKQIRDNYFRRVAGIVTKRERRFLNLVKNIKHNASEVTKVAMRAQDMERKAFMTTLRMQLAEKVRLQQRVNAHITRLVHERAIWNFKDKTPNSWGLSEIEGTYRTRIRLEKKASSGVEAKHYMESLRDTKKAVKQPFDFICKGFDGMTGVIIEQLNSGECVKYMENVKLIIPEEELPGELLLSNTALHFVSDRSAEEYSGCYKMEDSILTFTWPINSVCEIHRRWYQLNDNAIEIFFSSSTARFFTFKSKKQRNSFIKCLIEVNPQLAANPNDSDTVLKLWLDGQITNYEYLIHLNKLGGRSFNDLMQYPIFPFILSDYSSNILDLHSRSSFRDLKKPIAVQSEEKEALFKDKYKNLESELKSDSESIGSSFGPFHYGSHYSNTGIVLHFMIRVPPFTGMFLQYQDGNFDFPDRAFHSLESAWRLASKESSTDVKELIPDLFCLPEMLTNFEGFDFGTKQNGESISDVKLPPWAKNPRFFIKVHRQALECDFVRSHLNFWIDLVFGFKQSGKAAVESVNVFHPATYYGFDLSSVKDPMQQAARLQMIKTYGQTPKQLFKKAHPMVNKIWRDEDKSMKQQVLVPRVLDEINGLQWGRFLGSPTEPDPAIVWRGTNGGRGVMSFVCLKNGEVYGLPSKSVLMLNYFNTSVGGMSEKLREAALVSYEEVDGVFRAKIRKNSSRSWLCKKENVSTLIAHPSKMEFWIGFECGTIEVVPANFEADELKMSEEKTITLFSHSDVVTSIEMCPEFGIGVSASKDKTLTIWDSNSYSFIRSITFDAEVSHVALSRTSGDIAVATITPGEAKASTLHVMNVNCLFPEKRKCEPDVTSMTFSASPEGVSCNIIVTGHSNGIIRLWNSWTLNPLRDLPTLQNDPIVALTYSYNNENLYVATSAEEVIIFEKSTVVGIGNTPKFVNLTSL